MIYEKFLKSNGSEKVIRFLINKEFCHIDCDFLEDGKCLRFDTNLKTKGENYYLLRCSECLEFSKKCGGNNDCESCKI
jgi:hypothetical protein